MDTPSKLDELLKKTSTSSFRSGYITLDSCVLPERYLQLQPKFEEFEVFDSDLWICGFPKTGTTWISEIAWLILHDFDYEGAEEFDQKRTRMLEFTLIIDTKGTVFGGEQFEIDSISHARNQKSPRTIKTHFPFPLLPKQIVEGARKPRIIYTARNPMDTCISYYYHCKSFESFTGTFEEFCKLFIFDKAYFCQVNYGSYAAHVLSFWEKRNNPNILFLTYEEMKKDLPGVINKVATFLEKTVSQKDSLHLQEHVSFESMKSNPAVNKQVAMEQLKSAGVNVTTPFIRNGKSGECDKIMSSELVEQFRDYTNKKFAGSGLNLLDN